MKNLKGIIFDFDGTLADTLPICILSFQQALHKVTGIKYTESQITSYFGKSEEGIIQTLAPNNYDETLKIYLETYKNNHYLCPYPFDGMIEALNMIKNKGYKMALITGKGKNAIDIALDYMNLKEYFEFVEFGHPEKSIKTESIIKIAGLWNIKPSNIAYIGDQSSDIIESKKAGAYSIAVSWAKTSNHSELLKHEPDFIFSKIEDFKNWLLQLNRHN